MHICLVLGAGASLANALHFHGQRMRHTLPPLDTTFFETVEAHPNMSLGARLRTYFRDVLGREPTTLNLREYRMEEVFGDVYYDFLENQADAVALGAYVELVELYLDVLRETTNWLADDNRRGAPIGRLIDAAASVTDAVTIITFNHDLVIENEIDRRARLRDCWCVDRGYGSISAEMQPLSPSSTVPTFRTHDPDCSHRIQILKPHGSLSWVHRLNSRAPTARFLMGTVNRRLLLLPAKQLLGKEQYVDPSPGPGRKRWNLWPFVVPPIYAKQSLSAGLLQAVRDDAKQAMSAADRLVFFGYSLPALDVEAEKLFERSIQINGNLTDIDVINPQPASAARFAGVAPERRLRWHPSLRHFLEADAFQ
jgi:hypothetical protein